ncbi:carbamoyl-phosphate synthase large subunit [Acetanaerobacterium sp. MSJ-12]|uniref:carbamoyl-phosphate synthase large subunit n=1 Tax=Acetanaerobacterium sp. MSJ-12 TaxID=2841535 RepID=UPI001C0EB3AB|nr:carbamoyl-phosphate synthase large subunit [Acetanaerobacterium sp. MSJ-12]MBU5418611.1 carbamoyl-phosphate synthase large subunit [Acetanaerobacterium sp. MSJ-12]
MPKRSDIKRVLVIGSGPIVIGQAAEFDYAGTQACRALKEEGLEVILVNSNPATIMTDKAMADKIYIEPLRPEIIKKIIRKERPDSILPTLGGQTGLNLAMELAEEGFLEEEGVKLLGANPETIKKAEDRQAFKDTMLSIGEPCIPSQVETTVEGSLAFAAEIGYPVIVRPAYTLGGSGGGIAQNEEELREIAGNGLRLSPITQVLIEKCISGWKEIEYEVVRDGKGNVITVCNMENIDPVGVHTGDSVVVAPSQTLTDKEYQMLRSSAINIISTLGIEGGCNVQYALYPNSFEYAVIEVNPRVSRSSALASKATGYPIAKVAAKIAIGYSLDEIPNAVTGKTCACFEPTLDYCVVKFPRWPFDKFVYAEKTLGTQMKATGEVMAIARSFEQAMMKAVVSIELGMETLTLPQLEEQSDEEIVRLLSVTDDERLFVVYEAIKRGISFDQIFEITKIDKWFLAKFANLARMELALKAGQLDAESYRRAKKLGFLDATIARLSGKELPEQWLPGYQMVDTCAAEFTAETPYFYSSYGDENEAAEHIAREQSGKKKVVVFGSGPIRIGQGIEFDYCCVHCAWALKEKGYEAIIANNNPETVSTDFDTGDRLYFDPLNPEYVKALLQTEKPDGVVVQFGGQTAIKLTKSLKEMGVPILGTSPDAIDEAEDRERFDALLERCGIPRPQGHTVFTTEEAVAAAGELGYPVLLRPSYVLGGQNMIIAHSEADVVEYMRIITAHELENPVLIDKYLMGTETEVDAICDGRDYLIPGIMQHVERAGVHSGDSISVYPSQTLSPSIKETIVDYTGRLARELGVVGLMNIQYVVHEGQVYVIEVNPRSSRTVPYISKVTGVPMVDLATRCMLGESLAEMGYGTGLFPEKDFVAVKVPVFSFEKLHDVDTQLGPEMKSTGEVLGVAKTYEEALFKGLCSAGYQFKHHGGVLITVRDQDKHEVVPIADRFSQMGFDLYATGGTALRLNKNMVPTTAVKKIGEGSPDVLDLLESGKIDYVISTSAKGRTPERDGVRIRRKAVERQIPCLTAIDTADVLSKMLASGRTVEGIEVVDITKI